MAIEFKISLPKCPAGVEMQEFSSQVGSKLEVQKLKPSVREVVVEFDQNAKEAEIKLRYFGTNGTFSNFTSRVISISHKLPPSAPKPFDVSFSKFVENVAPVPVKERGPEPVNERQKVEDKAQEEEGEMLGYDVTDPKVEKEVNELVLKAKAAYEAEAKAKV